MIIILLTKSLIRDLLNIKWNEWFIFSFIGICLHFSKLKILVQIKTFLHFIVMPFGTLSIARNRTVMPFGTSSRQRWLLCNRMLLPHGINFFQSD